MKRLLQPLILGCSLILPTLGSAGDLTQIEVELPRNPGKHESLRVEFDAARSAQATVTLKTQGKPHRDSGFYCQKKQAELRCSGDDDSGRFKIRQDTIEIEFLSLNVAGEKILSYRGTSRPLKFKTLKR
jgi:hypothetical protein